MQQSWEPTHYSVGDGSPARLVSGADDDGIAVFENENGDAWYDPIDAWTAADTPCIVSDTVPLWECPCVECRILDREVSAQ